MMAYLDRNILIISVMLSTILITSIASLAVVIDNKVSIYDKSHELELLIQERTKDRYYGEDARKDYKRLYDRLEDISCD